MSHFSVLVIGDKPEKQLAPYHEFECTGDDNEYVQDVDNTAEVQEQIDKDGLVKGLSWYGLLDRMVASEDEVDRSKKHKYGYAIVAGGKLIKSVDRTNPNKRWDWYQLGGRWTGYFKLRPGANGSVGKPGLMTEQAEAGMTDQARKDAIDFQWMRDDAEQKARVRYQRFFSLLDGAPVPKTWEAVRLEHPGKIDEARTAYAEQPGIVACRKDEEFRWADDVGKDFSCTEDEYAAKARDMAITSFALVKDGQWYERGRMGWWACIHDEKEDSQWERQFSELLDSVPGDTLLSVYDCHI